jgi:hypothetical protein
MRQENLYETIHAQPFRPFTLVMADFLLFAQERR